MRILFIGQNPSKQAPQSSFVGTKSYETLMGWCLAAGVVGDIEFDNVFADPLQERFTNELIGSAARDPGFIDKISRFDLVFACGAVAHSAVATSIKVSPEKFFDVEVVNIPHPSGLNRLLNDKNVVIDTVQKMKEAYARKSSEEVQGPKKGLDLGPVLDDPGVSQRSGDSVCPVVSDFKRRKRT